MVLAVVRSQVISLTWETELEYTGRKEGADCCTEPGGHPMVPQVPLHDFHDPVHEVGSRDNGSGMHLEADPGCQVFVEVEKNRCGGEIYGSEECIPSFLDEKRICIPPIADGLKGPH
jgi:hypothetical protein